MDVKQVAPNELGFTINLLNGNVFVNTGFDASFGFQLAGISSVTFSNTTPSGAPGGFVIPGTASGNGTEAAGSLHMDGLGTFNFGLEGTGNGGSAPDGSTLTFDITAAGLTLADIVNNGTQFFGADVLSGTTGNTGGIDVSTVTVPAPLIGHGLFVLLAVGGVLFGGKLLERSKQRGSLKIA